MAMGSHGAVSSPHLLASEAAIDALRAGGNAVDAAVSAAAVSAVVQPFTSSFAGVGWASVHTSAEALTEVLQFSGIVPAHLDSSLLAPNPSTGLVDWPALERNGGTLLGTLVPGAVPGWEALLARRGTWGLARALRRAGELAEAGFPVSELLADILARNADRLGRWPESAAVFLPGGCPPAAGELLVQHDLAATIERISEHGAAELATGATARAIGRYFAERGGALSADDLATYCPEWHEPLRTSFRSHPVLVTPGPLGDVSFATGLELLDTFGPFAGPEDPDYIHVSVESAKLVAADRARYLGADADPELLAWLVSASHRDELRAAIGPRAVIPTGLRQTIEDTITLVVVDAQGNAVHLMQTVGTLFGTGAVISSTGMLANSSLYFAYARPGGANRIIPGFGIEQNPCLATVLGPGGELLAVMGSPGGKTRVETVRQMLANVVDFEMNLQQAVDARRFLISLDGTHVEFEHRYGALDTALEVALRERGHRVRLSGDAFGSGQAVAIDPRTGTRIAAADWRRESVALAY